MQDVERHATGRNSISSYRPVSLSDLVRLGRNNDGGYVISERCIAATQILVAFGISFDWSFEKQFAERNDNVVVLGLDGSVSRPKLVKWAMKEAIHAALNLGCGKFQLARSHARQAEQRQTLSREFGHFFEKGRHKFIERFLLETDSPTSMTWRTLRDSERLLRDLIAPLSIFVKMDIEGGEYRSLASIAVDAELINGLVVEFHDCDLLWERFSELMELLDVNFAIAHIHGNNCTPLIPGTQIPRTLEVSFVNRRLLSAEVKRSDSQYPLKHLDQPNDPSKPDYLLPL